MAYWSDSETIAGGSVTAGALSLGTPVCTPTAGPGVTGWNYAVGNAGAGNPVSLIVPGDTIAKVCTFPIVATGDNLTATLTTPDTTTVTGTPAGTSLVADVTATYAGAGGVITSADNGSTVTATIEVEFPFGTDEDAVTKINANNMQGVVAALNDITVTLVQTES